MELKTNADWFRAIESGDKESVLVSVSRFKGFADTNGETALMKAVRKRDEEMVKILAPHEHSWANLDGYTALMLAALNDVESICRILLPYESQYTLPDGTTSLMLAACNGSLCTTELLIPYLADSRDSQSRTALVRAIEAHQVKAVRLILRGWVHMIKSDVEEALSTAQRYDMADLCQIIDPYLSSTTPVHSSTYYDPLPGKLPRKTSPMPSATGSSVSGAPSLPVAKPYVAKDAVLIELEQKAAILNEITNFINAQTKLSSLTAADIIDYLTTVFSRNYILTAEKEQLQAELDKARRIIDEQALDLEASRVRNSSRVSGISPIGAANETYLRTLSDTQSELNRHLVELEEERSRLENMRLEEEKLISYTNSKLNTKASTIGDLKYVMGNFFDQLEAIKDENTKLQSNLRKLQPQGSADFPCLQTGHTVKELIDTRSKLLAKDTELEILRKTLSDVRTAHAELITESDILKVEADRFKVKQASFFADASECLSVSCKSYEDLLSALRTQKANKTVTTSSTAKDITALQDDNMLLRKTLDRVRSDQQITMKYITEFLATLSAHKAHPVLLPDANNVLCEILSSVNSTGHLDGLLNVEPNNALSSSAVAKTSGCSTHSQQSANTPAKQTSLSTLLELSTVHEEQRETALENKLHELESLKALQEQTARRAERLEEELAEAHKQLNALETSNKNYTNDIMTKAQLYDEAASAVVDVIDTKAQVSNIVISYITTIREENRRLRSDLVLARERVSERRLVDVLSTTDTTGQIDYLHREVVEYQHKTMMLTDNINKVFDVVEVGTGQRYHNVDEVIAGLTRHFAHVRCLSEQVTSLKQQENCDGAAVRDDTQMQYKEVYITATDVDIRKRNEAIVKLTEENEALKREVDQLRPYQRFYNERKCENCVLNAEAVQKLNVRLAAVDKNVAQLNALIAEKDAEIQKLKGEVAEHVSRQAELLATQPKIYMTKGVKIEMARPGSAVSGRTKRASSAATLARSTTSTTRPVPISLANIATMVAKAQTGGLKALIQANPGADLFKYGTLPHEADQLLVSVTEIVEQLKQTKSDDRTLLKDWTKLSEKIATLLTKLFKTTTDPQIAHKELEDCKYSKEMLRVRMSKTQTV